MVTYHANIVQRCGVGAQVSLCMEFHRVHHAYFRKRTNHHIQAQAQAYVIYIIAPRENKDNKFS